MIGRRVVANVVAFMLVTTGLVYLGTTRYLFPEAVGRTFTMTVADASGLLPRSDVTVRGVPAGAVLNVDLGEGGNARVLVSLEPGVTVTEDATAFITRRSPIGDITLDLIPGDGPPLEDGGHIPMDQTVPPPNAEETIRVLADLLQAVPPEDVSTVVDELAAGLRGRGRDLGNLAVAGADLSERILRVRKELESLMRTGPDVLDVLARNAETLGDDITQTAILADILRDRRFDLVELSQSSGDLALVLGELLRNEKANLACMLSDFAHINRHLGSPKNLARLRGTLRLNHFFFDGVEQAVRRGKDGYDWFRVHFLSPTGGGRRYMPNRPPPDVYPGNSCASRYGPGVGPGSQPHDPILPRGSEIRPGR